MSMEHEKQASEEVWQTVVMDIEYKIICGEYKTGERLPSIRVLIEQYSSSLWAIQMALKKLKEDDVLMVKRGVGYFVKPYVQSKIIGKHKMRLQKTIMDALMYGAEIGLSEEELLAPYHRHAGKRSEEVK